MNTRIGYACLTAGLYNMNQKSCIQKFATEEKLRELIAHNLKALERILHYNRENQIFLFRISSDIIPFGSSPVNKLEWDKEFEEDLQRIGTFAVENGMRLSMHPGQYTVINSPDSNVVERAFADLAYHNCFLTALGLGPEHKLILHIGGVYGDKPLAIKRFCENYNKLDAGVKQRLVIENDDKMYTIEDVLEIGLKMDIPVVFDNLHYEVNRCDDGKHHSLWISQCRSTWKVQDGKQKIHYSQQAEGKKPGSHSDTIDCERFLQFCNVFADASDDFPDPGTLASAAAVSSDALCAADDFNAFTVPDIMLEVKDKNLSAVKCILAAKPGAQSRIKDLEKEWSRYKYTVLERSPKAYQRIRELLKDKDSYPAIPFYREIDAAIAAEPEVGHAVNAAEHVWGYFKSVAGEREKAAFVRTLAAYQENKRSLQAVKNQLLRFAEKYGEEYLLQSSYFFL